MSLPILRNIPRVANEFLEHMAVRWCRDYADECQFNGYAFKKYSETALGYIVLQALAIKLVPMLALTW
jgi:hypothetical protein